MLKYMGNLLSAFRRVGRGLDNLASGVTPPSRASLSESRLGRKKAEGRTSLTAVYKWA